jgi:hypothetical protein
MAGVAMVAVATIVVSKLAVPPISSFVATDDDTFSVTAFIILYGLLFPRNDLGKYWVSMGEVS